VTINNVEKIELKEISLRSKRFRSRELCAVLKHQFRFLNTKIETSAPPSPSSLLPLVLRSPQFSCHQKAKNASNVQKKPTETLAKQATSRSIAIEFLLPQGDRSSVFIALLITTS